MCITYQNQEDLIAVFYEDDSPPFKDRFMGSLKKDAAGYYRFHPGRRVVMTQKHLRTITAKAAELNT